MRTADILARIKAQCPAFKQVDHALTSAAQNAYPCAFVAVARIQAEPNRTLQRSGQTTRWTVRVFVVVERRQDNVFGEGPAEQMDDALAELRAALAGWTPPGAGMPLDFVGGELADKDGLACWADDYATTVLMRA